MLLWLHIGQIQRHLGYGVDDALETGAGIEPFTGLRCVKPQSADSPIPRIRDQRLQQSGADPLTPVRRVYVEIRDIGFESVRIR